MRVPAVYTEFCTRRLLVQERFNGFTVADLAGIDDAGIDRRAVAEALLRVTLDQIVRIGVFHADPHPGNVFVFHDGTLGLIDFGAVGRLDPIQQSAVARHPLRPHAARRRACCATAWSGSPTCASTTRPSSSSGCWRA